MMEFERALADAKTPEIQVDEFRRSLRRELIGEERRRGVRRVRLALAGLGAATASLAVVLAVFVARPSLPARLHAALLADAPRSFEAEGAALAGPAPGAVRTGGGIVEPGQAREMSGLLRRAGSTARVDREWVDRWYQEQLDPARVKSLEDERIFAVRRFALSNGKRIVVYTDLSDDTSGEPMMELSSIEDF